MQEEEYMGQVKETGNESLRAIILFVKAQLAGYFGFPSLAASIFQTLESIGCASRFSHAAVPWFWNAGYVHYEMFRITGKRQHLRKARMYKKRLVKAEGIGCSSASMYIAFLVAEEASVRKATDDATLIAIYKRGIESAAKDGQFHVEGFLSERAGFALDRRKRRTEAEFYFQRALDLYRNEWGAVAKYQWLQQKSAKLLSVIPDTRESACTLPCGTFITVGNSL